MREKRNAQVVLERVELIDAIVHNKLIERQQWSDLATSITSNMGGEKVKSSGSQSKMADAVIRCHDMEAEIDRAVEKLVAEKREVTAALEKLDSPSDYKLLHMRYIQYIELKDIAAKWGKDYTTITTYHGRALRSFQCILDEK